MMVLRTDKSRTRPTRRRAISLVEVVVSTAIVGVLTVAAMKSMAASVASKHELATTNNAQLVAEALLLEILEQPYEDPLIPGNFGPETGETTGGTRALFDDVDDYADWSAAPPVEKDGSGVSNAVAYVRSVTVVFVDPDDLTNAVADDRGVKRITVDVQQGGDVLASLTTVVTQSWQLPPYE